MVTRQLAVHNKNTNIYSPLFDKQAINLLIIHIKTKFKK